MSEAKGLKLSEAAQRGFERAGVPRAQAAAAEGAGLARVPRATLREACELLLGEKVETPRTETAAPRAEQRPVEKLAAAARVRPATPLGAIRESEEA